MAKEMFEAIQAAEESAERSVQEAQRQARELLKETESVCLDNERKMAQEHRALQQSILEEKRAHVRQEIEAGHKEKAALQDAMIMEARQRLDLAAQTIFERVISDGDR